MFKKFSKKCSIPASTLGGWHIFGCACLKHKCVTFIAFIISFIFVTTFNITFKIISFFFVIFELSFPSPMALLKWCGICEIHFFTFCLAMPSPHPSVCSVFSPSRSLWLAVIRERSVPRVTEGPVDTDRTKTGTVHCTLYTVNCTQYNVSCKS